MNQLSKNSYSLWALTITLLFPLGTLRAEGKTVPHLVGTASCASSNCHGSIAPRSVTSVLQNEYVTWSKHDRHAKAWLTLTTPEAKKIGANLGINVVEKAQQCLTCHTTLPTETQKTKQEFKIEDGVGCESCHGAAEGYLAEHTAKGATHAKNVSNGLRDIVPLDKRAELCLSCHFGAKDSDITHQIMGAGHPRLSFELDTYSMLQPRHWEVDKDYTTRKEQYHSAKAWLIGQVVYAQGIVEKLADPKRSQFQELPEFTTLACYSCHHDLSEKQWLNRDYSGKPGELRLNTAPLLILEQALQALNSRYGDKLSRETKALHDAFREKNISAATNALATTLAEIRIQLMAKDFAQKDLKALLLLNAATGAKHTGLQYEEAEQIAMALSSILAELAPNQDLYENELKAIYATLTSPSSYRAEAFSAACKSLQTELH